MFNPSSFNGLRVSITWSTYKVCEKAGLHRIRIHDLRHTYATLRLSCGHNLSDVSKQLGHASINITVDTYFHWIPNQQRNEVAELDSLAKTAPIRNLSAAIEESEQKGVSQYAS
jgi:integrase